MGKFLTLKQVSEELGLPISTIRNICRSEACKKTIHRFSDSLTAPYYIDIEEFVKVIRSGKVDR